MIRSLVINKYLSKEFLKITLNMSLGFFCLGFVINLFEEINFFKDYNVGFEVPVLLSFLFVPSLLYKMFPFVILLSGIWFFLKFKKSDEDLLQSLEINPEEAYVLNYLAYSWLERNYKIDTAIEMLQRAYKQKTHL